MPFSDVCHQDAAVGRVRRALQSGRVPHAYLFSGRPGVGRGMLADRLAQYLLCAARHDEAGEPDAGGLFAPSEPVVAPADLPADAAESLDACGVCDDCRLFAEGGHPDFHPIYRELNRHHPDKKVRDRKAMDLSVDVVRHFLLNVAGMRPSRERAKVFVVFEAERLSDGAQNAMLKTLEEPPGHSYLILIATSADELLATTRSRCHHVPFSGLPIDFIVERLLERGDADSQAARFLAALSQGSLGEAIRLARGGIFGHVPALAESLRGAVTDPLAASRVWQELARTLATGPSADSDGEDDSDSDDVRESAKSPTPARGRADEPVDEDESDEEIEETGPDLRTVREGQRLLLSVVGALLGDGLRATVGIAPLAVTDSKLAAALVGRASPRGIGEAIRAVTAAERQLELNANVGLVFDALAIALSRSLNTRAA